MPVIEPDNALLSAQLDLIREIGRNIAGTRGSQGTLEPPTSNVPGHGALGTLPGDSMLPTYPDLESGGLQEQHSLSRNLAPAIWQSLAGLKLPKWGVTDGVSGGGTASTEGYQDGQEPAVHARARVSGANARVASSLAGMGLLTGVSDGAQMNAIERSRAVSATGSSVWSTDRAGAYCGFGSQTPSSGPANAAARVGIGNGEHRDAATFLSAVSLRESEMVRHGAHPGGLTARLSNGLAPGGLQLSEDASIQAAKAGAGGLATTERLSQAALAERALSTLTTLAASATPMAERAGVLASFVLNAHFLPGWPPLLPIQQAGAMSYVRQGPLIGKLGLSDIEILTYLTNLGLTRAQIEHLVKLRQKSGLQDAIVSFFSNLGTLLGVLQSESASISEEVAFRGRGSLHMRAGRSRIELR